MADKLSIFSTLVLLGCFGLLTLLLAGAAIGRVFGMSFGEALYLTGVLLVGLGWLVGNRVLLRRCVTSSEDREA